MKSSRARIAFATLAAGAALAAATASHAEQFHVSPNGGACISFEGITYDPASQYYTARWSNRCDYSIRINYSRFDPLSRQTVTNYAWVSANGSGSALLLLSNALDWYEVM